MANPNTKRTRRHMDLMAAIIPELSHLVTQSKANHLADVYAGDFGPEPEVTFKISIRQDKIKADQLSYTGQGRTLNQ